MIRNRYKIVSGYAVGIFEGDTEMMFDISDLELVSAYGWHIDSGGYPSAYVDGRSIRLHRLLIPNVPDGLVIDHINRNKLDNRRNNLRIITQKENCHNASIRSNNKSGVPGVFFDKRAKRWRAQIYHERKSTHVGIFDRFDDAVKARKEAECRIYGGDYHL